MTPLWLDFAAYISLGIVIGTAVNWVVEAIMTGYPRVRLYIREAISFRVHDLLIRLLARRLHLEVNREARKGKADR